MNFDKPWSHGRSLDGKGAKRRWSTRGEEVEPKSLGDALSRLLAGTPLGGKLALADPATRAGMERAWGAGLAARCQPVSLEKGVLSLRVKEAAWRYELGFRKGPLLAGLQKECPSLGVTDLRFLA
jgi:predicted nucleic acid-binding Zn ribbon protein